MREAPWHAAAWAGQIKHQEEFCFDSSKIGFPLLHVWLISSVLYLRFLGIAITLWRFSSSSSAPRLCPPICAEIRLSLTSDNLFLCSFPLVRHGCAFGLEAAVRADPRPGFWCPTPRGSHFYRPPEWVHVHGPGRLHYFLAAAEWIPCHHPNCYRHFCSVFLQCPW